MNRLALLLVLVLPFSLTARADEASHRAKAEEMMTLLKTQDMVQHIAAGITKQVDDAAKSVEGASPNDAAKAKAADFEKQASKLIEGQLSWDSMKPSFVEVYTKNFTEEELDGIIAFYKSPAGAALLGKMPAVNSQVTQFGNSRMSALQPQLKQLFEDFRKSEAAAQPAPPVINIPPAAPASNSPAPASKPTAPAATAPAAPK